MYWHGTNKLYVKIWVCVCVCVCVCVYVCVCVSLLYEVALLNFTVPNYKHIYNFNKIKITDCRLNIQSCVSPLFPTYSSKKNIENRHHSICFQRQRTIAQQSCRYEFNYRIIFMQQLPCERHLLCDWSKYRTQNLLVLGI